MRSNKIGKLRRLVPSVGASLVLATFATPALAGWWIVRSSDGACLVVDLDPTSKREAVKNVGKDSYSTEREAKADLKRVCEE